jgi:hypothetical protein
MDYVSANARADVNYDTSLPSNMACVLWVTTTLHVTCATTSMHTLERFVISTMFLHAGVECHLAVLVECTHRRSPRVSSWALHPPPVVANPQIDHHFSLQLIMPKTIISQILICRMNMLSPITFSRPIGRQPKQQLQLHFHKMQCPRHFFMGSKYHPR